MGRLKNCAKKMSKYGGEKLSDKNDPKWSIAQNWTAASMVDGKKKAERKRRPLRGLVVAHADSAGRFSADAISFDTAARGSDAFNRPFPTGGVEKPTTLSVITGGHS